MIKIIKKRYYIMILFYFKKKSSNFILFVKNSLNERKNRDKYKENNFYD